MVQQFTLVTVSNNREKFKFEKHFFFVISVLVSALVEIQIDASPQLDTAACESRLAFYDI